MQEDNSGTNGWLNKQKLESAISFGVFVHLYKRKLGNIWRQGFQMESATIEWNGIGCYRRRENELDLVAVKEEVKREWKWVGVR